MKKNALTEENLKEVINNLIKEEAISVEEKKILLGVISKGNGSFMKKINNFKTDVLKLQLDNGFDSLSTDMLNLYTEICRQYPTTGPTSIFNKFIKK